MKNIFQQRVLRFLFPVISFLCLVMFPALSRAYDYVEILPSGWQEAEAHDINNAGTIVGSGKDSTGAIRGFMFSKGEYVPIAPPGWEEAHAHGINNNGDIVGHGLDRQYKGFLYSGGTYTEISPPGWAETYAYAINDKGAIVGYGRHGNRYRGFLFEKGTYTEMLPPGWTETFAFGINNSNIIAGYGRDKRGRYTGFLYSKGIYRELIPPGWAEAKAIDINDKGDVVGHGIKGTYAGFIYSGGHYMELAPPGEQFIEVYGINNSGEAVGRLLYKDGNMRGFIYSAGSYQMLLPQGWQWAQAYAINDIGKVIGFGYDGFDKKGLVISGTPQISVSSEIIFFGGNIRSGDVPDNSVTVKNNGTGELKIGKVTVESSLYIIAEDECSGQIVLPAGTCRITYRLNLTSEKKAVSNSYIPSNDPQNSIVSVTLGVYPDHDNDGYTTNVDCNDNDPLVNVDCSQPAGDR